MIEKELMIEYKRKDKPYWAVLKITVGLVEQRICLSGVSILSQAVSHYLISALGG